MTLDPRASRPVLAVAGLAREARIAAGPGVETIQAGGSPTRLRAMLAARSGERPRAVVSFGIAGGLDPELVPGDIVIGSAVVNGRRHAASAALVEAFVRILGAGSPASGRVVVADLAGVETAVMTVRAKAALRAATGAAAVDMESQVAAAWAGEHGLPFTMLRVVCDPAQRALPRFAANALKPNGDPDVVGVLAALARREAKVGELVRLARDSGAAFRSLGRARALLGLALGIDA